MSWSALPPEIRDTAREVLSVKEFDALRLKADGWNNDVIARRLDISRSTVRERLERAYRKLLKAGVATDGHGNWYLKEAA